MEWERNEMTSRRIVALAWTLLLVGCGTNYLADSALKTANDFWAANKAGDIDMARVYVLEGSSATLTRPEDGSAPFQNYTLGKVKVDDDVATIDTKIVGMNGASNTTMEFKTVMRRLRNVWWVDLDSTTGEIMQVMLGINMEELGAAMEEAMGQAMQGVAEGMQDGMEKMAQQMNGAMKQAQQKR